MQLSAINEYFEQKPEPIKSCMLALRYYILNYNNQIAEAWKYRMPFFCINGKMFVYLWTNKESGLPYVGIVEGKKIDHPLLIQEKRSRMKILPIDPEQDLPISDLDNVLNQAIRFYK